jgi:hypothetical protein
VVREQENTNDKSSSLRRIYIDDIRSCGLCTRGAKNWFERHSLDFKQFLKHGIDEKKFLETGDSRAQFVVNKKHEKLN